MIKLKKDNTLLLKSFVESDFLFLNKKSGKRSRFLKSNLKVNGSEMSYLDSLKL